MNDRDCSTPPRRALNLDVLMLSPQPHLTQGWYVDEVDERGWGPSRARQGIQRPGRSPSPGDQGASVRTGSCQTWVQFIDGKSFKVSTSTVKTVTDNSCSSGSDDDEVQITVSRPAKRIKRTTAMGPKIVAGTTGVLAAHTYRFPIVGQIKYEVQDLVR